MYNSSVLTNSMDSEKAKYFLISKQNILEEDVLRVEISFKGKLFHNFYALKECWFQLQNIVDRHYPELKLLFATELGFLFDEDSTFSQKKHLEEVAVGSSERRLSKESEQVFRLIWGMVKLIHLLSIKVKKPICLRFDQIVEADRMSLQFISYLSSMVSNKICILIHMGDIPSNWGDKTINLRKKLLDELISGLTYSTVTEIPPLKKKLDRLTTNEEQVAHQVLCGKEFSNSSIEKIIQHFIMWGNYEAGMHLIEYQIDKDFKNAQNAFYWMKKGLIYAFCNNFKQSMECYEHVFSISSDIQMRTAACMYLALLSSKRLGVEDQAQKWIEKGFSEGVELVGIDSDIEIGWLCNVRALSAFREKNYKTALYYTQKAFNLVKARQGGDALHLKINVLSNMSVLYEKTNNIKKALSVWTKFDQFVNQGASEAFIKIYRFRLGALQILNDECEEGLQNIKLAYSISREINDVFHASFIAQELAIYACHYERWKEAIHWFRESALLARDFGENAFAAIQEERIRIIEDISSDQRLAILNLSTPVTKIGRPFYPIHIPNPLKSDVKI